MKKDKKTSINNKGFTLIEIIAVVIIIGILVTVGGISVTSYIIKSKNTTYESYKKDLKGASENYFIDCMTNNEEGCDIPIPQPGNSERITYDTLVSKGYSERLKDPEGDGYCDQSYVIATNTGDTGVNLKYQVCLFCSNYKSTEDGCKEISDSVPPTCGVTKGESTEWTNENKVITVKCNDNGGIGCKKNEFSKSLGKDGEVITTGHVTIEDKAGNKTNCPVNVYVDRKAPTCKIEVDRASADGWYRAGVVARITDVQDEGSGVALTGMGTSLVNREYNEKTTYSVTKGIVTVFGYVKDRAGNEGYCSKEVKVDTTNPTGVINMGYEIYPREVATISRNKITIQNISRYGKIDGVIVYFKTFLDKSIESDVKIANAYTNGRFYSIKESGGFTVGNNKGIIKASGASGDELEIQLGSSGDGNKYTSRIAKIELIKKEDTTSVWTNKDVSVYVDASDTLTGVNIYSYNNGASYTTSNIKTYAANTSNYVMIRDKVGNLSEKYKFTINKIDKTPPILTVSAHKCSDYSSDAACHESKETIAEALSSTDGSTITVDWTNQGVDFVYFVTETNFDKVERKWNEGSGATLTQSTAFEFNDFYLALFGEGHRKGQLIAYDKAGNRATINLVAKIDRQNPTAPTAALVNESWDERNNDTWYNHNIYVSGGTNASNAIPSSTDPGESGIDKYQISKDNSTWVDWSYDSSSDYYKVDIEGTTYRYVRAVDNAGNISDVTTKTIKIDKTVPECTLKVTSGTKGNNNWYTTDVGIGFDTHTDTGGSEVSTYGIGDYTSSETTTLTADTTEITYTGYIKDGAGNTNTCTITVKKDDTKPNCGTIKVSGTEGFDGWYRSDVTISRTNGSDATSGHASTTIDINSITNNTNGTKVTLTTKDNAGNTCQTSRTIQIDKDTPRVNYVGACTPSSGNNLCNEFIIEDGYAVNIYRIRSHCMEYDEENDNKEDLVGNSNYCLDGFRAVDRVNYYYKALDFHSRKTAASNGATKSTITYSGIQITDDKTMYEQVVSNQNGVENLNYNFTMNTSLSTVRDIEYAFIVCDQAGNCSGPHKYLYQCTTKKSKWTCLESNVTNRS